MNIVPVWCFNAVQGKNLWLLKKNFLGVNFKRIEHKTFFLVSENEKKFEEFSQSIEMEVEKLIKSVKSYSSKRN